MENHVQRGYEPGGTRCRREALIVSLLIATAVQGHLRRAGNTIHRHPTQFNVSTNDR